MKTSENGIEFIKSFEGFSPIPYPCSGGKWTIGYGNRFYPNGNEVTPYDPQITKARAQEIFVKSLVGYENIVNNRIKVDLNQNMFDALVSHTYNTGGSSTLFKLINDNDPYYADWWLNHYITANGKKIEGLRRRRGAELELFLKPI